MAKELNIESNTIDISKETRSTRRLTILYIAALSMVAVLSITGQVFVQLALKTQSSDSRIINIAGRQRMLSQRLSKAALVIGTAKDIAVKKRYSEELLLVADLWERSHRGLQHGDAEIGLPGKNSEEINRMFEAIEEHHQKMLQSAREILKNIDAIQSSLTVIETQDRFPVSTILNHEHTFVEGMDSIVFQYDKEAKARVVRLKIIELSLLTVTLLILSLEGFFVFRPAVRKVIEVIEQLKLSNMEIEQKNQALFRSEAELSEKNARIIDSLLYAERIQQVILPSKSSLIKYFPDCFLFFRPKDIVSGDFYWFSEVDGTTVIAVGDCTGHGVPGALMSMFGNALLSQIVVEKNILEPAAILEELHIGIRKALKQEQLAITDVGAQDGMDIAICIIDPSRESILFAGAHHPLYYCCPEGEINELKSDRKGIGGRQKEARRTFTSHQIPIKNGVTIYLTTDGFSDQPNEEGIKYGTKRLKKFLNTWASYPMDEQYKYLEKEFINHCRQEPQRDDITVMGVKITPLIIKGDNNIV
ncbi:MAG: SpoIIE family protein phosphatase [Desulfamplus sp.]|nr:SpoIIE family protein phosphatase [Desulfamplus sp.]